MSALNSRQLNAIPLNAPGAAVAVARALSVDCRTIDAPWGDTREFVTEGCESMAKLNVVITKFVVGDDLDIERTYGLVPVGTEITHAWITFKRKPKGETDAEAVVQLEVTLALTSQGQITDSGSVSGKVKLFFALIAAQTALFIPGRAYYYDIQLKTATGKINTREVGTIIFEREITQAA